MKTLNEIKELSHKHPIMFFDGECIFCSKAYQFFVNIDKEGKIKYATLQSDEGKLVRDELGISDALESVVLIDRGEFYDKSDVTFQVFKSLKQPWKAFSILRFIPRSLRNFFYHIVAKNRYKIFGKYDQCMIPDASQKHLFIND